MLEIFHVEMVTRGLVPQDLGNPLLYPSPSNWPSHSPSRPGFCWWAYDGSGINKWIRGKRTHLFEKGQHGYEKACDGQWSCSVAKAAQHTDAALSLLGFLVIFLSYFTSAPTARDCRWLAANRLWLNSSFCCFFLSPPFALASLCLAVGGLAVYWARSWGERVKSQVFLI